MPYAAMRARGPVTQADSRPASSSAGASARPPVFDASKSGPRCLQRQPAVHLLLGGDPLRTATAHEADQPVQHRGDPALEADDVEEVEGEPHQPGDEALELELARGRRPRGTGRSSPSSPCRGTSNGPLGCLAGEGALDLVGGVPGALDGHLGDAGQLVQRHHVADDVHLGVAGQGEVGQHRDPAGAVDLGAGLLAEHPAERAGLHAGGPDLGGRVDPADLAVAVLDLDAVGVDVGHHRAELHLDAGLVQLPPGAAAEPLAEGGQHVRGGVEQDDAGGGGVDAAEVLAQGAVGELGDLAGHLHPGRAGADDDEGQQPVDLGLVLGELGELEGAEDPAAQLEGVVDALHAGRELGEPVVAEVGLAGAGGDDQLVVGVHGGAAQHGRGDRAGGEVDVGDLAEDDAGVLLAAQDLAGRGGDLALGQDAGRHLVEQRLEQVVAGLADQRDVDVGLAQPLGGEQPAESGADDDDARAAAAASGWRGYALVMSS